MSELDKSVESTDPEDDDSEEGEEAEEDVTNSQQSYPPPPPRVSSTQPSHSKSLLPQRIAPSRWRQPQNFHPTEDSDDADLDKPNWQRHGSRPYFSSEPPHQTFSGPLPSVTVTRPLISAPEPSGISRALANATGQISSPVPSQLARHGSVRSTSLGAGHHPASASPHDKPNLSSLGEAVRFPVSVSPGSQSIRGLQHFPEKSKQGIPIPSHIPRHGSVRSNGSTGRSAGQRHVAPLNSYSNRGGLHEQQISYSASPLDKPNPSSLSEAVRVRFPVSASPGSESIHGLHHFPEKTKQSISSPSHLPRHGSDRSTGSTGRGTGHRYVTSPNSDLNRGVLHEQQTSYSASPLDKPNLSSLGEAVRFPVSVSPGSQPIHGLQRFPEVAKQGIPISRRQMPTEDIVDEDYDQRSVYNVPRIRIMRSRQSMDSEQVDGPWDIKEAQQLLEQAEHVEEGLWQADSPHNLSEVGTQKKIEPNHEMDAKQREAELRTCGAIAETREAEAKRIEAEAEKSEAEAQTSEAQSQAREAEFQTRVAEAQTREAIAKRYEAEVQTRDAEAQARDAEAQTREAGAQTSEAEAKAKDAEAQRNWVESRHRFTTAWPTDSEEEVKIKDRAHFFGQACRSSEAGHIEIEAKMCSTAPQTEAVTDSKVADTLKREASVQTMEADTQRKEEELRHRESEAFRLEERARQALAEAKQLEAVACQAEDFAKMLEIAAQQKEAAARSSEAEAKKLEVDVQNREAKVRLREEEVGKMEEKVCCVELAHQSSVEADHLVACAH